MAEEGIEAPFMANAQDTVPYGRKTQRPPALKEVHILWVTAGLGGDGGAARAT